jgi:imidazolonepropionase-like amidohydrolase
MKSIFFLSVCLGIFVSVLASDAIAQIAIKAKVIYTMSGEPVKEGIILINNGKIENVGYASDVFIPENYDIIMANVVTPGLIDAHTVVGLSGILNYSHDQDQLDKTEAIQPELRAIDAYNNREALVEWLRNFGITTIHTGHAPGALASGQTMIVKTYGENLTEAIISHSKCVAFSLGSTVSRNFKKPGSRSKGIAMLRQEFLKAKDYLEKRNQDKEDKKPARNLRLEALADVLEGKLYALFTVNQAVEIMGALRLAEEFNFKLILDGAAEAYLLINEIKKAGVPIILHPTMVRNYGSSKNASFETAKKLKEAGITFAIQSGYESYVPKTRLVLFEAAVAHANGLSFQDALASITIDAAKILGIENRVGMIEPGKDADVVLFDGNPFEYTTHVCQVIINGEIVKEDCY